MDQRQYGVATPNNETLNIGPSQEYKYIASQKMVVWRHPNEDVAVIYNSLIGNGFKAGGDVARIAEAFRIPRTVTNVAAELCLPDNKVMAVVDQLVTRNMLMTFQLGEQQSFSRDQKYTSLRFYPLRLLRLYVTKTCNMACTYCFEPEHNGPQMNLDTLTRAVRAFRDWLMKHPDQSYELIKINFFGGEPLVCKDLLRQAVPVIYETMQGFERKYKITINTNATLITPEVAHWLVTNRIMVYTSLDGLLETNDRQRVFHNGRGSFNSVMRGLAHLIDAADSDYIENYITILCTVSSNNLIEVEALAYYLYEMGIRNLAFNAAFSCAAHVPSGTRDPSHWTSMTRDESRDFVFRMIALQKELIHKNFHIGGMWAYVPQRLKNGGTVFCQAVGNEIGVSHAGKLYPCPTTLDNESACIGELSGENFAFNHISYKWNDRTNDRMEKCTTCDISGICRGGCPASAMLNGHDIYDPQQCDYWFSVVNAYLETYTSKADELGSFHNPDKDGLVHRIAASTKVLSSLSISSTPPSLE